MPSYQNFLEGLRSEFSSESGGSYNLVVEYLDVGRSVDDAYVRHMIEMYNEKLKSAKIDLIITFPPFTYPILEKYGLTALSNVPVIKIEADPLFDSTYLFTPRANILEIKVKFEIPKTLKTIFELFPEDKDVYIISGNSFVDRYFEGLVNKSISEFRQTHHFIFVSGITLDSTIKITKKIPENNIVIIPMFLTDVKNVSFSTPEAIGILASNCKAPVFPLFDSYIKTKGGIGGYIFSYTALGKETGRFALEILYGKNPQNVDISEIEYYQNIYDWQELKRWGLTGSKAIPANSIFFNKEFDFFAEYKWHILVLVIVVISETILVLYLFRLNRRQREMARKQAETEHLYRVVVREDRLSRMSELTASLSHELNQPLTAILYYSQAGKRFIESGNLDEKQAGEIFESIIEDTKRAGSLISSVKSLMKMETREKEEVNLNAMIRETINIFYAEAISQDIRVSVKLNDNPVIVFGDKIQLQQVLLNLLSNAANAMKNSDPDNKRIDIIEDVKKDLVLVSVRDSGPGIDEAIKDKLFNPFVTSNTSGFGIGLALSRSIIENHGGTITAENITGGGAEFAFKLSIYKNE